MWTEPDKVVVGVRKSGIHEGAGEGGGVGWVVNMCTYGIKGTKQFSV